MNEDYRMDFDERRQYAYDKALEILNDEDDAFDEACEELDNWNGFLGDDRCYSMDEIDEFFSRPSELVELMDEFDPNEQYFYYTAYGYVNTTDNKHSVYSDDFSTEDVLDALIDNYSHVDLTESNELNEFINVLVNEDFGIDYDWNYDEVDSEDDMPEETDDEFMGRIDDIY
jgi:hypothetical protein